MGQQPEAFPAQLLIGMQAILDEHWLVIEPMLPVDDDGIDFRRRELWARILKPSNDDSEFFSKLRLMFFRALSHAATYALERDRAARVVGDSSEARQATEAPSKAKTRARPVDNDPKEDEHRMLPTLSRPLLAILKRLVASPTPLHRSDLAGKADPGDSKFLLPSDEETIGDYLNQLIDKKYADRPFGPRKGAVATEMGKRFVVEHRSDASP